MGWPDLCCTHRHRARGPEPGWEAGKPKHSCPLLFLAQVRDGGWRGTPEATVTQKYTNTPGTATTYKATRRHGTAQSRRGDEAVPGKLLRATSRGVCSEQQGPGAVLGTQQQPGEWEAVPAAGRGFGGEHNILHRYPHANIHRHVTPNAQPPGSADDGSRLFCFV